jgi:hypothetical protein
MVRAEVKRQFDEIIRQASLRNRVPLALNTLQTLRSQISLYMVSVTPTASFFF